jgi:hypothetical protein
LIAEVLFTSVALEHHSIIAIFTGDSAAAFERAERSAETRKAKQLFTKCAYAGGLVAALRNNVADPRNILRIQASLVNVPFAHPLRALITKPASFGMTARTVTARASDLSAHLLVFAPCHLLALYRTV